MNIIPRILGYTVASDTDPESDTGIINHKHYKSVKWFSDEEYLGLYYILDMSICIDIENFFFSFFFSIFQGKSPALLVTSVVILLHLKLSNQAWAQDLRQIQ